MKREKFNDSFIGLRIPLKEKLQVEALVKQGQFLNASQVIRAALKEFLTKKGGSLHE